MAPREINHIDLGASVKESKQEIPGMGWFAVVSDPEGDEVGLFQSGRSA